MIVYSKRKARKEEMDEGKREEEKMVRVRENNTRNGRRLILSASCPVVNITR